LTERLRILGIDPGSRTTGYGVVDLDGGRVRYVASGCVKSGDGSFCERLRTIYRAVQEVAAEFQPQAVAVESVFVHRNAMSALKLGQARSAALCATFALDITVYEYAPREIKLAIVGTGAATKEQVQHMVSALLNLQGRPYPDAADALAAALCHGHQRQTLARLTAAASAAGSR
jgi:crossover junction endodeoxyribonuclease RuvC